MKEIYLIPKLEKDLHNRLRRVEGHIRAVQRMLSEHQSCEALLLQISAIKSAINQIAQKLVEGHLATCVLEDVRKGKGVAALNKLRGALSKVLK